MTIKSTLSIFAIVIACALPLLAETLIFSPGAGSYITVTNNGAVAVVVAGASDTSDPITYISSSQGAPSGCSETFGSGPSTNQMYAEISCTSAGSISGYTYTVRALSSNGIGGSATVYLNIN